MVLLQKLLQLKLQQTLKFTKLSQIIQKIIMLTYQITILQEKLKISTQIEQEMIFQ